MTREAWEALLDRFERDLDADEPSGDWTPPASPLPEDLAPRARDIVARQQERMLRLRDDLDAVSRQQAALERVPREEPRPAFLDIAG